MARGSVGQSIRSKPAHFEFVSLSSAIAVQEQEKEDKKEEDEEEREKARTAVVDHGDGHVLVQRPSEISPDECPVYYHAPLSPKLFSTNVPSIIT